MGEGGRPDLQNITYKYDNVGNITNRKNNGFNTNDDVVRNSEQSYEYDNMDRLTESSGRFNYETWNPFWDKRVNTYTSEYTYSKTGKILQKAQENKGLLQETNETVTIAETTYNWNYEYTGAHPNAVTKAGPRTYSYDLNGNMTQMKDSPLTPGGGTTTMTRTLTWDDENRLLKTTDSPRTPGGGKDVNVVTTYGYDAAGMRALKKGKIRHSAVCERQLHSAQQGPYKQTCVCREHKVGLQDRNAGREERQDDRDGTGSVLLPP